MPYTVEITQFQQPVYDGRSILDDRGKLHNTRGPPIALFHEVFAVFRQSLRETDALTPTDFVGICDFAERMQQRDHDNEDRETALHERLTTLCELEIREHLVPRQSDIPGNVSSASWTTSQDITETSSQNSAGGIALVTAGKHRRLRVPGIHVEIRFEQGSGSGDPIYQIVTRARKWVIVDAYSQVRTASCMPCFLVICDGPVIHILGFVWAGIMIVEPLCDPIYVTGSHEAYTADRYEALARLFRALRTSLGLLKKHYADLTRSSRILPRSHQPRFTTCTLQSPYSALYDVDIKYHDQLWPSQRWRPMWKATVSAIRKEDDVGVQLRVGQVVLVKFASRYSDRAHRLLADKGLAPQLFSCRHLDDGSNLIMVIMELLEGTHAQGVFGMAGLLPPRYHDSVRTAVNTLHQNDLVFGDLRLPNILIRTKDDKAMVVDFDWCGKEQETFYPADLAHVVRREGIVRRGPILKDHDSWRFEQLTGVSLETE